MRGLFRSRFLNRGTRLQSRTAASLIALLAPLILLCLFTSSRPAWAQTCVEQSNCPGILWYAVIPIDITCAENASIQYSDCLSGVSTATPGTLLGGVTCCAAQFDLALCACPPPSPPVATSSPPTPPGPAPAPVPGKSCNAGDSAHPGTGIFTYQQTDLELADVMPIQLGRSYRESDGSSRAFGIGMASSYDLEIVTDPSGNYSYVNLVLPNGAQLYYPRISPGNDFLDGVYQHTSSPTIYFGSTISWNGSAWVLSRKDGTQMLFAIESMLTTITDRNGNSVQIQRPGKYPSASSASNNNATLITSPSGRWISLTYDPNGRVERAQDNASRTVWYTYDSGGHLSKVYDANGGTTAYSYDSSGRMASYTTPNGNVAIQNQYDGNNRITTQTRADGGTFNFAYTLDSTGNVAAANMTGTRGMTCAMEFSPNGYLVNDVWAGGTAQQETMSHDRDPSTNFVNSTTDMLGRTTSFIVRLNGQRHKRDQARRDLPDVNHFIHI